MALNIIVIGNPGAGKSTLLNILSNGHNFKGGYSLGTGLTQNKESVTIGDITYIDTPGLNDIEYARKKIACQQLSDALKEGASGVRVYKVFFVLREDTGRIIHEDQAVMNQVMASVPELTVNNYGVILNKVSDITMSLPDTGDGMTKRSFRPFLFQMFKNRPTDHLLFVPTLRELACVASGQMDFAKVRDLDPIKKVLKFTAECPSVHVTKEKVTDLDPRQVEHYQDDAKKHAEELKGNEAKIAQLQKEIDEATKQSGAGMGAMIGAGIGLLLGGPAGAALGAAVGGAGGAIDDAVKKK